LQWRHCESIASVGFDKKRAQVSCSSAMKPIIN
jgi:hypothetical protein